MRVPFGGRKVRGVIVTLRRRDPEREVEEIASIVFEHALAPPPIDELMRWVSRRYVVPLGRAFDRIVPPRVRVRVSDVTSTVEGPAARLLTVYERGGELLDAISSGASGTWLVRPVAGESRGALVAELVGAAAASGKGAALVTVPEVHYGSHVLDELERRWPGFARVDSARSDMERSAAWLRLAAGHPVGGGGRSAVFAPTPRLRVIVVDEEDHRTYKEDRAPRYDARRVAIERARLQDAVCVLVSATPSAETGAAAVDGRYGVVEPRRDQERSARPIVELVERPSGGPLTRALHARITEVLLAGERVALLVPSRGYARALWCDACKRSLRCPRCESGFFYERGETDAVRCPRCGWWDVAPQTCPSCGASRWRYVGAGSARVAEQIAASFPRALVTRVDPDAPPDPTGAALADIYVTTWLGTKAAVRPDAKLVAVLNADVLTRRPDFRAGEAAYQALAELAEWAGPADRGGRLLIQTSEPSHFAIQAVVRADYGFWLERELAQRKELHYPPFSELVKITGAGPLAEKLITNAGEICRDKKARVLGPVAVPVVRGARGPGLELLVKCDDAFEVAVAVRELVASAPAGNRLIVDVDPR